jgi:hypothetical protein
VGYDFMKLDSMSGSGICTKFDHKWPAGSGEDLKRFSHINKCKNSSPYCDPSRPPGAIILKKNLESALNQRASI